MLKVMFSAIVTAMLGAFWLGRLGVIDLAAIYVPETFLAPQIVGGLIFGVGFVLAGLCPGTSCVAAASGRGRWTGDGRRAVRRASCCTGLAMPAIGGFYASTARGAFTLPQLIGAPYGVVVARHRADRARRSSRASSGWKGGREPHPQSRPGRRWSWALPPPSPAVPMPRASADRPGRPGHGDRPGRRSCLGRSNWRPGSRTASRACGSSTSARRRSSPPTACPTPRTFPLNRLSRATVRPRRHRRPLLGGRRPCRTGLGVAADDGRQPASISSPAAWPTGATR